LQASSYRMLCHLQRKRLVANNELSECGWNCLGMPSLSWRRVLHFDLQFSTTGLFFLLFSLSTSIFMCITLDFQSSPSIFYFFKNLIYDLLITVFLFEMICKIELFLFYPPVFLSVRLSLHSFH
jgi:hypothetical protein